MSKLNARPATIKDLIRNSHILETLDFACEAHEGQKRKYTGDDYIVHPIAVAEIVAFYFPDDVGMIQAALLHDVVEDTTVTLLEIKERFGHDVSTLVGWLTEPKIEGNRKTRKGAALQQIAISSKRAQIIKLADLIDNSRSIVEYDPDFAVVYLREKEEILKSIKFTHEPLWATAMGIVNLGYAKIGISQ